MVKTQQEYEDAITEESQYINDELTTLYEDVQAIYAQLSRITLSNAFIELNKQCEDAREYESPIDNPDTYSWFDELSDRVADSKYDEYDSHLADAEELRHTALSISRALKKIESVVADLESSNFD